VTAITVDFESGPFAAPPMSEVDAIAALVAGHEARAYKLPDPILKAARGAAALVARANDVHLALNATNAAVVTRSQQLISQFRDQTIRDGKLPAIDAGAEMALLRAELARLTDEDLILGNATEKAIAFPPVIARAQAAATFAALDAALGEILAQARPHSKAIGRLNANARDLAAHRVDAAGFDRLDALTGRLLALDTAAAALQALGRPWPGAPVDGGDSSVVRLARLATGTPSEG
jgi:hypothetical protein